MTLIATYIRPRTNTSSGDTPGHSGQPLSSEARDCTTRYLCLPCPLPIASSNKSLQGKDPLAFPLPVQKCLELGNFTSVFCKLGGKFSFEKKMFNFLSFLVLLYVSGDFKQKKISKFFPTDRKILTRHQFM